jgi:imidazolonepropionase-like amidohydrolase
LTVLEKKPVKNSFMMIEGVEPGSPQFTIEKMASAIEEAHKAGKKTATHAQGTTGIKNAIKARIDSIEKDKFTDFLVLDSNPLDNIDTLFNINSAYRLGNNLLKITIVYMVVYNSNSLKVRIDYSRPYKFKPSFL